ncbi:hypothetical protein TNCV_3849121 [Trichonephila clavipes]|uniref:Uncharacterized protein n=1 Tax=Trichonephila clavipes TaxID=2585209 RepID=A0A8X6RD39_TRICX|nr:hypothetical protein TNCV_3849121 [Trichonephila clavipes]
MASPGSSFTPTPLRHEDNLEVRQHPRANALQNQRKFHTMLITFFDSNRFSKNMFQLDKEFQETGGNCYRSRSHVPADTVTEVHSIDTCAENNSPKATALCSLLVPARWDTRRAGSRYVLAARTNFFSHLRAITTGFFPGKT